MNPRIRQPPCEYCSVPTYIAFLRAINLGAKRVFPKEAIVAAVQRIGFTEVRTHINTGNVTVSMGRQYDRVHVFEINLAK